MNTFINNFVKSGKQKIKKEVSGSLSNVFTTLTAPLLKYKRELEISQPRYDSLILALTHTPELFSDNVASLSGIPHDAISDFVEIPESIANDLLGGVTDAITNNGYEPDALGMTITDAKGYAYNICKANAVVGTDTVLLSMTNTVSSVNEAILYTDEDGKYYFNNMIRTCNYTSGTPAIVVKHDILGCINTCNFLAKGQVFSSIEDGLRNLLPDGGISSSNIMELLYENADACDIEYQVGVTQLDLAEALQDYYIEHYSLEPEKGGVTAMWSVLSDLVESSSLNQAILTTIEALTSANGFTADFFTSLEMKVGTKYNSVKTFISDGRIAWLKGGFRGLASYLLSYIKAGSSLTNSDGLLSFSDNSSLVPQQYIAGIVWEVASAVGTLVGILVSMFSRIAGAMIIGASQIFKGIYNAVNYDKTQTYASLVQKDSVQLPIAPYALWQFEMYSSQVDESIISLFENGNELVDVEVPGGYLIIGPSSVDSNADDTASIREKYPTFIAKFYPSIIAHDQDGALSSLIKNYLNARAFKLHYTGIPTYDESVDLTFDASVIPQLIDTEDILDAYADSGEQTVYVNNQGGEYDALITGFQDLTLKRAIAGNIVWFLLYYYSLNDVANVYPLNSIYLTGKVSNVEMHDTQIDALEVTVTGKQESALIPFVFYTYFEQNMWFDGSGDIDEAVCSLKFSSYPDYVYLGQYAVENDDAIPLSQLMSAVNFGLVSYPPVALSSRCDFAILLPKYDATTFMLWLVLSIAVTVAVTVAVIAVTVKAKKAINQRRAINQAKVEQAWSQLSANPTADNYSTYRKAVRKNNLWATFIGGTRYDYQNYWNGDVRPSTDSESSIQGGLLSSFDFNSLLSSQSSDITSELSLDSILKVIVG